MTVNFMVLWCRLPFVAFAETVLYIIVVHIPGRLTSPMKKETHIQILTSDPKTNNCLESVGNGSMLMCSTSWLLSTNDYLVVCVFRE